MRDERARDRAMAGRGGLVLTLALALGACAPAPYAPLVCDASEGRLAAFGYVLVRASGHELLRANGSDFLYVAGDCTFYARPSARVTPWEPVHTGVLTPDELDAINGELLTQPWPAFLGAAGDPGPFLDATAPFMFRDSVRVDCGGDCGAAASARARAEEWMTRLYARGEPLEAAVWLVAYRGSEGTGGPPIPVSLALDLATATVDPVRVTGEDAATLRAARTTAMARPEFSEHLPVVLDGVEWSLHLRDALPLEDESGRVPWP